MPTHANLPAKLSPPPSDREAISDAIHRAAAGLDTDDADLFNSAFTDSGSFDLDGRVMAGRGAINTHVFGPVSKLDTLHVIGSVRVSIDEGGTGSTASATASAVARHYRGGQGVDPDAPGYTAGVLYWVDLVRGEGEEGGLWRVEHWRLRTVWGEGDRGVMTGN